MDDQPSHRGAIGEPPAEVVLTLDHRLRSRTRRRAADRRAQRALLFAKLRALLRLGAIERDRVVYVARRGGSIPRALTTRGSKSFDVRFPSAPPMRVRLTPARIYPDLIACGRATLYAQLDALVRPGDRIGELGCGVGAGSAWLAARVGATGSVQSWEPDAESVRFARRRYPLPWLSFEVGDAAALGTELAGVFNGLIIVHRGNAADAAGLAEPALRVVARGGFIASMVHPTPPQPVGRRLFRGTRRATDEALIAGSRALPSRATPDEPEDHLAAEVLTRLGRSLRDGVRLTPAAGWAGAWTGTVIRVPGPGEGVPSGV